jgi:hypothetical protein
LSISSIFGNIKLNHAKKLLENENVLLVDLAYDSEISELKDLYISKGYVVEIHLTESIWNEYQIYGKK